MSDGINRWSQAVRRPGAVEVVGWHPTVVPRLGEGLPVEREVPGIRLLTLPRGPHAQHWTLDITSSAAIAMLEGFLSSGAHVARKLSWEARGFGRRRRDTIHIHPPGNGG